VREVGISILPDLLANNFNLVIVAPPRDARPLIDNFTTPVRAIASGAHFTKSDSLRSNCGQTTTLSYRPGEGRSLHSSQ
jgi:hypothetical protein